MYLYGYLKVTEIYPLLYDKLILENSIHTASKEKPLLRGVNRGAGR